MFKKLKDKIEEEFKQSPLRLTASVQQIAQVISPSASANSLSDNSSSVAGPLPDALSVSSDFFSIGDDRDSGDSTKTMHNVDLTHSSPSVLPPVRSRRSSISSVASDVSSLFPSYESPLNHSYLLQSEWESEVDDNVTTQLEKITKEQLYQGYKKLLYRYNKYKGRFVDLSRLHKDLQYDNMKTKNVLQESQDKALRRIAELREQCQLEQKAKAHLEESLRNDLEERDHIINTLNTKIDLLKSGAPVPLIINEQWDSSISQSESVTVDDVRKQNRELIFENERLQTLVQPVSAIGTTTTAQEVVSTEQVKEKITELKSGIVRMKSDNESISNLLSKSPSTSDPGDDSGTLIDFSSPETDERDKKIDKLNNLLLKCKEKINSLSADLKKKNSEVAELSDKVQKLSHESEEVEKLKEELSKLRKTEESNALTIAENKMTIHKELEAKELHITSLTKEIEEAKEAASKSAVSQNELQKVIASLTEDLQKIKSEKDILEHSTKIDTGLLSEQKNAFAKELQKISENHQKRCLDAVSILNNKLINTEHNFSLCRGYLSSSRSVQTDLKEKIRDLESRLENSGDNIAEVNNLKKKVTTLEAAITEKEKIVTDHMQTIENLNQELNEKIDRLFVIGNELDDLKERSTMQISSYEEKLLNFTQRMSEADTNLRDIRKNRDSLELEITTLRKDMENQKMRHSEELKEATNKCNETLTKNQYEASKNSQKLTELNEKLKSQEAELAKLNLELQNSKQLNGDLSSKLENLEIGLKSAGDSQAKASLLEVEMSTLKEDYSSLLEEKSRLAAENQKFQEELDLQKAKLNTAESKFISDIKEKTSILENDIEKLKSDNKTLEVRYNAKDTDYLNLELRTDEIIANNQSQIESLRKELDSTQLKIDDMKKADKDAANQLNSQLEAEVSTLRKDNEDLQVELTKVKTSEADVRNQLIELTKENEKCKAAVLSAETDYKRILQQQKETSELVVSLQEKVERLTTEKSEIRKEFEILRAETERSSQCYDQEIAVLLDEKTKKADELISLQNQISSSQKVLESLQTSVKEKEETITSLTEEKTVLERQKIESESSAKDLKEKLESISNISASKEVQIAENDQCINSLKDEISSLSSLKEDYLLQISNLKEQLDRESANRLSSVAAEKKLVTALSEYETKIESLTNELNFAKSELLEMRNEADISAANAKTDGESKVSILKNEIKFLNDKFEQDVANINRNRDLEAAEMNERLEHSEKMAAELLSKLETAAAEREELRQAFDEKTLKVSELEGCLSELKSNLDKNFNDTNAADLYEGKLKKLVNDFEIEIAKREETIRDLEHTIFENRDMVSDLQSLRQEVTVLRKQVRDKDDTIECKIEEIEKLRKDNRIIDFDSSSLIEVNEHDFKSEHKEVLLEVNESHSENNVTNHVRENKHEGSENSRELSDWIQEKKELERTSQVALAAVESSKHSMDLLRQEVIQQTNEINEMKKQHKREVSELRKLAVLRSRRPSEREREGEDVEHEYLRNILYEYMMGREQMVLAKVLAAIVKFDHQQTQNILEKQSSASQLRIL